jgi:hypothetical protein
VDNDTRIIKFAGRLWVVKSGDRRGPGPNCWSDSEQSVWVDENGWLHLRIRKENGRWYCAEVFTREYTCYGLHCFYTIGRLDNLDPNVVFAPFLYKDDRTEIDIEFTRWGEPNSQSNGQYVVQPSKNRQPFLVWKLLREAISTLDRKLIKNFCFQKLFCRFQEKFLPTMSNQELLKKRGYLQEFMVALSDNNTTHSIEWHAESIRFKSFYKHGPEPDNEEDLICEWEYSEEDVPLETAHLNVHINLWLHQGRPPLYGQPVEMIVKTVDLPVP